jgi:hypothetical protein
MGSNLASRRGKGGGGSEGQARSNHSTGVSGKESTAQGADGREGMKLPLRGSPLGPGGRLAS